MGMDVYGKKPSSKEGEYFRNNVWYWHPLWGYCCEVAPHICDEVRYGHTNDGDGLDGRDSRRLGRFLKREIACGRTEKYAGRRQVDLDSLPDEPCRICGGTGKRLPAPQVGAGDLPCNGCEATGKVRPTATWYSFSVENVEEFASFLLACGGFGIC